MAKRVRLFVLFVMLMVGATSVFALPDHEIEIDYYTDATLTEWCGYRYYLCGASWAVGGCQTTHLTRWDGPDC